MVRTPCCKAEGLKKGAWTPEEDRKLIAYINKHGEGGWRTLPEKADLLRCGKSCRLRWTNYLRPDIKRGEFSAGEEEAIIKLHSTHGNKWSAIARRLPGRTDNEIKNYWNTHVKKRLIKKGIDPVTHKPISQNSDGPETISEKSRVDDNCEKDDQTKRKQQSSSSGSARLLNRVANGWGRRVNQSVLTEIIERGGASGGGPRRNSDSVHSDSDCENAASRTLTSSSTSTSKLLNKMAMTNATTTNMLIKSIFENNNHASASASASAPASSSTFSDSSASINNQMMYCLDTPTTTDDLQGISSETEHHMDTDDDIFKFLNNISNCGGFSEDHMGFVENSGFMKELANILVDERDMVSPLECARESYCRAFDEIESYLDGDCMILQK